MRTKKRPCEQPCHNYYDYAIHHSFIFVHINVISSLGMRWQNAISSRLGNKNYVHCVLQSASPGLAGRQLGSGQTPIAVRSLRARGSALQVFLGRFWPDQCRCPASVASTKERERDRQRKCKHNFNTLIHRCPPPPPSCTQTQKTNTNKE